MEFLAAIADVSLCFLHIVAGANERQLYSQASFAPNFHLTWMEIRFLFGINYNKYLSVSLSSLPHISIYVIMCSIQSSLFFTCFTPQIAAEKQVK